MRGQRGISKVMDLKIDIFFLFIFISNQVILERSLDFLVISVPISMISLDDLRGNIGSFEVTPIISILGVPIALLSFKFQFLHFCRKWFYQFCQFIHLRVGSKGIIGWSFIHTFSSIFIILIPNFVNCQYIRLYFKGCILHMS